MRVATTIWGRPFKVQVTAVLTDRDLDDGSGSPRPHFPGDPVSEESRDHTTPRRTILDVGKTGGANLDDIDALLYKPGSFVCPKCGFVLEVRTISVSTGQIGIRKDGEHADPCPNDGETMNRVTWKDAYLDSPDPGHELMLALIESVKLQRDRKSTRLNYSLPLHDALPILAERWRDDEPRDLEGCVSRQRGLWTRAHARADRVGEVAEPLCRTAQPSRRWQARDVLLDRKR